MQWSWVTPVAVSVIGVGGAWLQARRGRPQGRDLLKQDLKLLRQLPPESTARDLLIKHIDDGIVRLIKDEEENRRDPLGIGLAIFFILLGLGFLTAAAYEGGLWWLLTLPAVAIGVLGSVGLRESMVRRKRNEAQN